jgi:hypothetical protein
MLNTRIRYQTIKPGVLQSRRRFTMSTGQEVLVELDLIQKKFRILDSITGVEFASGGNTRNVSVLKIQAKRGLNELGIQFTDETRTRGSVELNVVE